MVERLPGAVVVGGAAHRGVGHGEAAEAGVVEVAERVGGDLRHELLHHGRPAAARRRRRRATAPAPSSAPRPRPSRR